MLILSLAFSASTSVAGYLMEYTDLSIQNGLIIPHPLPRRFDDGLRHGVYIMGYKRLAKS